MKDPIEIANALKSLVGLRLTVAAHAGSMRGFGFSPSTMEMGSGDKGAEWFLHISCSWRIDDEQEMTVLTGSFDWTEPESADEDPGPQWDPTKGGSLQEARLRELFQGSAGDQRILVNTNPSLIVVSVECTSYGDISLKFKEHYVLRVFVTGSRGELWRVFKKGELGSHFVLS